MPIKNILVYLTHPHVEAWNFKPQHKALLERQVPGLNVEVCLNSKDFKDHLPQSEAAIVWFFKKQWLDSAPKLKLIATPAAGKDWIEVEEGEGLLVSFGGFHGSLIAESVIGSMFYFLKAFPLSVAMQKQKNGHGLRFPKKCNHSIEAG